MPTCCAVGLVDRLLDVLRIVGGPAQEHAVGAEVDRPELDVGFLEETVRRERNLEVARDLLAALRQAS